MAGYVYLIGSRTFHWFKIGRSRDARIRVKELGVLLPFKIEVIALWRADAYKLLESTLHLKYQDQRINGEWFRFDEKQIEKLLLDVPYTMIQVQELVSFSNVQSDSPEGTKLHIVAKPDFSPEEREARKQKAIAERGPKVPCPSCGRGTRQKKNTCA